MPAFDAAVLRARLEPVVTGLGLDLEDVRVSRAGRRSVVAVAVDADGGVTLDTVADVTRAVSDVLDADDSLVPGDSYVLEVGTPGVDRPLTEPRHWRRAVDRLVAVTPREGSPVTGRVTSVDDDGLVVLDVDGTGRTVDPADVARAVVQVEFNRKA